MHISSRSLLIAVALAIVPITLQGAVNVGSSTWTWQNPLPQGNGLNSVSCPTTTVCFAVGDLGTILATTNGGSTWSGQASPTTRTLHGISCPNTTTCYAVGDGGVILKTDSGTTWFQQPSGTGANLNGISCPSSNECMAVGSGGTALITTNSGATWLLSPPTRDPNSLVAIACHDVNYCFVAGSFVNSSISPSPIQAVWVAFPEEPLGEQWSDPLFDESSVTGLGTSITSYTPFAGYGDLMSISIVPTGSFPSGNPVVVTDHGYVLTYMTESPIVNPALSSLSYWAGGPNRGPLQVTPESLYAVACPTPFFCNAVGAPNSVFFLNFAAVPCANAADNGCVQFTPSAEPSPASTLNSMSCPTEQCFAVGSGGAITTNPGGALWESRQTTVTSNPLISTSCPAEEICYTVGWNGTILATTNGGGSWIKQFSGTDANLQAIHCPNSTTCFTVGENVILATTSSGSIWSQQTSGTSQSLNAIHCPSTTVCYAAGGVILSTTNGGSPWKPQMPPPSGTTITGLACTGTSTCIAVATGPVILTTTTGFATYTRQNAPTTNPLTAVSCLSASTCIAVGNRGTILLSTNGGASWSGVSSPTAQDLTSITCLGATCYAGTFEGQIISSFDSGGSWGVEAQLDPNPDLVLLGGNPPRFIEASGVESLSCASSSSNYQCLAVGSQGTILSKFVITRIILLGTGDLTPSSGSSAVGDPTTFSVTWTVPSPQVWRDLKYVDLRLADNEGIGLWARFIPGSPSAFALLDANGNIVSEGVPGAASILDSPTATLGLAHSSFEASGPTSPTVTVNFAVALKSSAAPGPAARVYATQILITNVSGETSAPDDVGHWAVRPNH